jgi:Ca-activated chloride channel family protein
MLTFAHSWLFLLLPLPLLVRWLLPPFHTARPAVRLPFFAQVVELTGSRSEAGAAVQRRSAVQGIGYVVVWCALVAETVPRMAGPKTAFGDAIGLSITLFERSAVKRRVMIALTDGNDTGSQVPPAEAAQIAQDKGIVIHTVAMGDPATVGEDKLDEEALRAVAQTTGGQYFFAADRSSLEGIYGMLDQVETRQIETISHRPRRDLFHWPLGFATVLSLMYPLASSALGAWRSRRRGTTAPQETAV